MLVNTAINLSLESKDAINCELIRTIHKAVIKHQNLTSFFFFPSNVHGSKPKGNGFVFLAIKTSSKGSGRARRQGGSDSLLPPEGVIVSRGACYFYRVVPQPDLQSIRADCCSLAMASSSSCACSEKGCHFALFPLHQKRQTQVGAAISGPSCKMVCC